VVVLLLIDLNEPTIEQNKQFSLMVNYHQTSLDGWPLFALLKVDRALKDVGMNTMKSSKLKLSVAEHCFNLKCFKMQRAPLKNRSFIIIIEFQPQCRLHSFSLHITQYTHTAAFNLGKNYICELLSH